ncbi:Uncharacterized protein pbN1_02330 [Aromatoleum bremense]|nr:Uncharacterized protein pbN1_02330 [Aromatoleum bremense]
MVSSRTISISMKAMTRKPIQGAEGRGEGFGRLPDRSAQVVPDQLDTRPRDGKGLGRWLNRYLGGYSRGVAGLTVRGLGRAPIRNLEQRCREQGGRNGQVDREA